MSQIDQNAAGKLHEYLEAQGIPVVTVRQTGTTIQPVTSNPAQQTQANTIASTWSTTLKIPKLLIDIFNDITTLTSVQKTNIVNDLFGSRPQKWEQDPGPNAAAMGALVLSVGGVGSMTTQQKIGLAAMYVQDNPKYLINPSFDTTINVSGDQPAP